MKKWPLAFWLVLAALLIGLGGFGFAYGFRLAVVPMFAGAGLIALAGLAVPLRRRFLRVYKVYVSMITALCAAAMLVCAVASAQILSCYFDEDAPEDAVMLVLGCGLSPTDQTSPSLMLSRRLDAALDYLNAHPAALCVVSGGQGPGERVSEAQAMYDYLTARGVDPARLYRETESTSTAENLALSQAVLAENGIFARRIIIVTDGFHEFRAHTLARRIGLEPYTVSSHATFGLTVFFWAREIGGVVTQCWLGLT